MKKITAVMLALIITAIAANCSADALPGKKTILREGFVISGEDGTVYANSNRTKWLFKPFNTLSDGRAVTDENSSIGILNSSTLEKLAENYKDKAAAYRLWGKLTKYNNKNYLYLTYFLPITKIQSPETKNKDKTATEVEQIVPKNVMAMLRPKRKVNFEILKHSANAIVEADKVVLNRTGFLKKIDDKYYFNFDAMGRNINPQSFEVLKSNLLKIMQNKQNESAEPLRYKIAAVLTSFNGKYYLLIQRATIAHSYGNFAR